MVEKSKNKRPRAQILFGLFGFLLGAVLAAGSAAVAVSSRANQLAQAQIAPAALLTLTPAPSPTFTRLPVLPTLTWTPQPTADSVTSGLGQAQLDLNGSKPDQVLGLVLPLLNQIKDTAQLAQAYRLLGDAEVKQEHFLLAAGYYEQLYSIAATPENLFLLASAYANGGDLAQAEQRYSLLMTLQGPQADEYRSKADTELKWIRQALGITPNP